MRKLCLVVCFLTACGDDGVRHTPDAAPHDGPVTADAPADAAPLPVTITTTRNGSPYAGVQVYFQNADGTVVLATTTDANGTASAVMDAGGYVTALKPYGMITEGADEIDTFAGVKPGDHLVLDGGINFLSSITVNVFADADPAATSLYAYSACGSAQLFQPAIALAAPSAPVTLYGCGTQTDFLIVSTDQNGAPLNFFYAPNVAVADMATVDLTGTAYAAAPSRTYTFSNAGTNSVSFQDSLVSGQGQVYTVYGNAGSAAATYPVPAYAGAQDVMRTQVYPGGSNMQIWLDWGAYADTFTTDVAARMLPLFMDGPNFDPATHVLSFTEQTGGATPDFVYGIVAVVRQAENHAWNWRIAAPHGTSITYPVLPTDLYDYNPTANDIITTDTLAIGHVPGGYDAVRPYILSHSNFVPQALVTGATGHVEIAQWALLAARVNQRGDTMAGHASALFPRLLPRRVR